MARAIDRIMIGRAHGAAHRTRSWERRISDHVAYALLVYTGLQIFVVINAIKGDGGSILPYFGLVVLVGVVIPACRRIEKRWQLLSRSELSDHSLALRFARDRLVIWLCAIGLPFALVALFKGVAALF